MIARAVTVCLLAAALAGCSGGAKPSAPAAAPLPKHKVPPEVAGTPEDAVKAYGKRPQRPR
ncbi:MAG TPA: hypothetical protein VIL46_01995 [Gemmataceae bacterium]